MRELQTLTNAKQSIVAPHSRVMVGRNRRGPIFRNTTVAGGCHGGQNWLTEGSWGSYLKNNICDEENKYNDGVSWSSEEQINSHPADNRDSKIRTIHQADAIHESEGEHQSSINATDDLPLFRHTETANASIVGFFRGAAFEIVGLGVLFLNVRRHDG
jgi:hypothetical protein